MDLASIVLAPVKIPLRVAKLLDDISVIAEHSGRDPDPVEEVRDRVDLVSAELAMVAGMAKELVDGGAELTAVARGMHATMFELLQTAQALVPMSAALEVTAEHIVVGGDDLNRTGMTIHEGGRDLLAAVQRLDRHTIDLIDGGKDLVTVSERLDEDLRVFRAALPRLMEGLDVVEQLEDSVETVAETVEPLQGAAERVGRVTLQLTRAR